MDCFREVDENGGKIESFVSWCGGLPAADFSDNPLRSVSKSIHQWGQFSTSRSVCHMVNHSGRQSDRQLITQADSQTGSQSLRQSDWQPITQADRQPITQADSQTVRQADRQLITQSDRQSITQADSQTSSQSLRQTVRQAANHSDRQPITQVDRQAANHSDSQTGSQSLRQTGSQSVRWWINWSVEHNEDTCCLLMTCYISDSHEPVMVCFFHRYRFSWSPLGVLMNLKAGAKWMENGEVCCHRYLLWKCSKRIVLTSYACWCH